MVADNSGRAGLHFDPGRLVVSRRAAWRRRILEHWPATVLSRLTGI